MIRTPQGASRWAFATALILILGAGGRRLAAQSPRKPPARPLASSSSPQKEDPLAPLLEQAKNAMDKNDFAAAVDPLQKYLAARPDDPYAHFQLGYAYASLKRGEEAKSEFSRALALDPKMAPAHLNLGLLLLDGNPAAAAESFRQAAALQPSDSRPLFLAGLALERAGKFPDAAEQYRAALALSPKDYEYHLAFGSLLLRTGDPAGAEEHFQQAVDARNDSANARLGLANALLAQHKYQAGTDALADYLKLNPGDRAARLDRVAALLEINRLEDALAELERAESSFAPTAETLKMRADIYMRQKKWKESSEVLAKAISVSPQDPDLPAWLGHAQIEMRNYPAAIKILSHAQAMNPSSVEPLRDLADAFFQNGDYAASLDAMDQLEKLEPPKPVSWFFRGICYDKLARKAEAIAAYQKFLGLDNGQHDTQDFQARRRIYTLQSELGQLPKGSKR